MKKLCVVSIYVNTMNNELNIQRETIYYYYYYYYYYNFFYFAKTYIIFNEKGQFTIKFMLFCFQFMTNISIFIQGKLIPIFITYYKNICIYSLCRNTLTHGGFSGVNFVQAPGKIF